MQIIFKNMSEGLTKKILLTLAITGAFAIAATSPYFLINFARAYFKNKKYDKRKIAKTISRLKKNRLIILNEENGSFIVKLTEKGKKIIKKYQLKDLKIKTPKVWDGKWRVIIFDIPDKKKKKARDALRWKLKELNFYPLQKSVWVCPYPCEDEIHFLAELFEITPYVNIVLADKIFDDTELREYFKI